MDWNLPLRQISRVRDWLTWLSWEDDPGIAGNPWRKAIEALFNFPVHVIRRRSASGPWPIACKP